jgi:hypothetical protein
MGRLAGRIFSVSTNRFGSPFESHNPESDVLQYGGLVLVNKVVNALGSETTMAEISLVVTARPEYVNHPVPSPAQNTDI